MSDNVKEIDVFHKYTRNNKLKVILISSLIALVVITLLYFVVKAFTPYYISYETYGGTILGQPVPTDKYAFLEKTREPQNVKKEGFYIEKYCTDESFNNEYKFGNPIWQSAKLYIDWRPGYALVLNFADSAEEQMGNLSTADLKLYYEQYVKPGSTVSLPIVYNTNEKSLHYGEQLLWYENPECTGMPLSEKSYVLSENIQLYGKWYETTDSETKWDVDENGVLQRYLGRCNKVFLPDNALKIKDIVHDKFTQNSSDQLNEQDGTYYSAFQDVLVDMQEIFVNPQMTEIGNCAFRAMAKLKRVEFLGNAVTRLGEGFLEECTSIKEFIIPEGVTVIEKYAFRKTEGLQTVHISDSVVTIEDQAFIDSGVKNITVGKNVEFVGKLSFACPFLKTITFNSTKVIDTNVDNSNNNIFLNTPIYLKIYIPENLVSNYKASYPWNVYISKIHPIVTE